MCLVLLAYRVHPRYPLILAANRDEFYDRPTAAASFWEEAPGLLAGRDLVHGGTWLGVTGGGRVAALTNYRDPNAALKDAPSRGALVGDFLKSGQSAEDCLRATREKGVRYNGYNLLLGDVGSLFCYSNVADRVDRVTPGIHGLSNHLLDTPWPKVVRGKELLAQAVAAGEPDSDRLFGLLADRTPAPDHLLPDTGVGLDLERLLSSIFITSERYGTRSSTLVLVDLDGETAFVERSFDRGNPGGAELRFTLGRRDGRR